MCLDCDCRRVRSDPIYPSGFAPFHSLLQFLSHSLSSICSTLNRGDRLRPRSDRLVFLLRLTRLLQVCASLLFMSLSSTPPPSWSPSVLHFYCRRVPLRRPLRSSRLFRPSRSSSPPGVCWSRSRSPEPGGFGRNAASRAGRTRRTFWPVRSRARSGGPRGRTARTESGRDWTGCVWRRGKSPFCFCEWDTKIL